MGWNLKSDTKDVFGPGKGGIHNPEKNNYPAHFIPTISSIPPNLSRPSLHSRHFLPARIYFPDMEKNPAHSPSSPDSNSLLDMYVIFAIIKDE